MTYLQPLVDQGKSSWNISERLFMFGGSSLLLFSMALALLRYFMGPFFLDSDSLQAEASVSRKYMSKRAMFSERSCKHAKMFAMVFCTEPESEDFAYWDDDGMKVLHCDHTFELRSQESSLSLYCIKRDREGDLV